jgi:hypothetical protein
MKYMLISKLILLSADKFRLQALGQPYLAYHAGLERDSLAFHGCAERFQVQV